MSLFIISRVIYVNFHKIDKFEAKELFKLVKENVKLQSQYFEETVKLGVFGS